MFKTIGKLSLEKIRTPYYTQFENIVKSKKGKVARILVKFGYNYFTTVYGLILDINETFQCAGDDRILQSVCRNLLLTNQIEASCCCVALNGCIGEISLCTNFKARSEHFYRFASMHNSHRSSCTACCCSGIYNPDCKNYPYIRNSLNFSVTTLHTVFLHYYPAGTPNEYMYKKRIDELIAEAAHMLEDVE